MSFSRTPPEFIEAVADACGLNEWSGYKSTVQWPLEKTILLKDTWFARLYDIIIFFAPSHIVLFDKDLIIYSSPYTSADFGKIRELIGGSSFYTATVMPLFLCATMIEMGFAEQLF